MEIPILIDASLHIAWDYLDRMGEIVDVDEAGWFLTTSIQAMVQKGELRKLVLANRAISAYQKRQLSMQ
jgi:hypothetical protein